MFPHMHGRHRGHGCKPHWAGGHRAGGHWAGGGHWAREAFGGGEGRRRRMFDGGELRLVLLKLIADQPRHGYDLIKAIEELTAGSYAPSPGVVYPTLTMLAAMGFAAEQQADDTRKRYAATDEGRAHLKENAATVDALMARLAAVGEQRGRTDAAPIRRAMGNLKVALGERLTRGGFSEDTVHDVAALIDEVAQKIERLR